MARQTILSVRAGQCRYCVDDGSPHLFCGEATDGIYCDEHYQLCYLGHGKDVGALEETIYRIEKTVFRRAPVGHLPERQPPVDTVIK